MNRKTGANLFGVATLALLALFFLGRFFLVDLWRYLYSLSYEGLIWRLVIPVSFVFLCLVIGPGYLALRLRRGIGWTNKQTWTLLGIVFLFCVTIVFATDVVPTVRDLGAQPITEEYYGYVRYVGGSSRFILNRGYVLQCRDNHRITTFPLSALEEVTYTEGEHAVKQSVRQYRKTKQPKYFRVAIQYYPHTKVRKSLLLRAVSDEEYERGTTQE